MAAPELDDKENAHLRRLMLEDVDAGRFGSRNKLAQKLEIQGSSLGKFLNEQGGSARSTAHKFAEITGRSVDEVLGHEHPSNLRRLTTTETTGPRYQATPQAARAARAYLSQPPQNFTDDAITHALAEAWFESKEDAARPSRVAEACRLLMLGSVARFPLAPPPSKAPPAPAGTRRSKMRAR